MSNKQQNNQNQNQGKRSNDPWASSTKTSSRSMIEAMTDGLIGAHSPQGLMVIGWGIVASSQVLNTGFWISVFTGAGAWVVLGSILNQNYAALGGLLAGVGVSLSSSFFQNYPIVQSRAQANILSEMLAGLFRPQVKHLPRNIDADRAAQYQGASSAFSKTMKTLGRFSTLVEIAAGIIFMGSIFGGGLGSLLALLVFVYSVVGTQIGTVMIVQAHNVALPPAGRDAKRKLEGKAKADVFQALKQ